MNEQESPIETFAVIRVVGVGAQAETA